MKTRLSIFAGLLFLSLMSFSQNTVNLVVFSEDGDKFYAYVNGIKQNDIAGSNVKVTNVTPNISLRIEFEDKALPQLKQNMALEPGFEHTAKIKRNAKKEIKLRYFGSTPLNDPATSNIPTVAYHTAENDNTVNNNATTSSSTGNSNTSYNTTSTTTQISTGTAATPNGGAVNINIDGVGVNMNVNGMGATNGMSTTYSTTSTTVSTTTSSTGSPNEHHHHQQHNNNNQTELQAAPATAKGCRGAMTQANFDAMKKSVEAKPFSDTKMSTAKIAAKNNCLSVNQIKEICKLFSMDDDKLTYAKYAYDYCVDKANYYQVSEVFSFSTSSDDLNQFLEKH